MLLMRLRATVRDQREISLSDLAHVLDAAPDVVERMLDHWIARGCIEKRESPCAGKTCACACSRDPVYVWAHTRPGATRKTCS